MVAQQLMMSIGVTQYPSIEEKRSIPLHSCDNLSELTRILEYTG